jgi:hypothetical protein
MREARNQPPAIRWILIIAACLTLLTYGFAITGFSISIDEEQYLLQQPPSVWIEQGRWAVWIVETILAGIRPLPFLDMTLAVLLLFCAGVLWAHLFMHANASGRSKQQGSQPSWWRSSRSL